MRISSKGNQLGTSPLSPELHPREPSHCASHLSNQKSFPQRPAAYNHSVIRRQSFTHCLDEATSLEIELILNVCATYRLPFKQRMDLQIFSVYLVQVKLV